jgi:hypothetical protein
MRFAPLINIFTQPKHEAKASCWSIITNRKEDCGSPQQEDEPDATGVTPHNNSDCDVPFHAVQTAPVAMLLCQYKKLDAIWQAVYKYWNEPVLSSERAP